MGLMRYVAGPIVLYGELETVPCHRVDDSFRPRSEFRID